MWRRVGDGMAPAREGIPGAAMGRAVRGGAPGRVPRAVRVREGWDDEDEDEDEGRG